MAARRTAASVRRITRGIASLDAPDPLVQCLAPALTRSMATAAPTSRLSPLHQPVLATVFHFPSLEPSRFVQYAANELQLPLRRDLLHRAVIYEGDSTRQGTASTKDRSEVRGSTRKIRPQKGTGRARLGDKKSPMLVGGGVAHGPKPRDFSTQLPRKIYDLAWRTALSYRYKKGELLLLEDEIDVEEIGLAQAPRLKRILDKLHLGRADGGSMFVLSQDNPEQIAALSDLGLSGKMRTGDEVDVKDLLTKGHLLIQKRVLDHILQSHSSDLNQTVPKAVYYE